MDFAKECWARQAASHSSQQRRKGVRICSPVEHAHTRSGAHMHEAAVRVLCRYTGMERDGGGLPV